MRGIRACLDEINREIDATSAYLLHRKGLLYVNRFRQGKRGSNPVFTAPGREVKIPNGGCHVSVVRIDHIEVASFKIPTHLPEFDGTLAWNSTTLVSVRAFAGNRAGLRHTYADFATAALIHNLVAEAVKGADAFAPQSSWSAMSMRARNLGRPEIVGMTISAVDIALWDLKARLQDIPLIRLLGAVRSSVPIYGSGGFTSYSEKQLQSQLAGWVKEGIPRGKQLVRTASFSSMRMAAKPSSSAKKLSSAPVLPTR